MRNIILLLVAVVSLSSCGAIERIQERQLELASTPEGREILRQQFTLDSIRASRTAYPFRYNFNYYNARWDRGLWIYPTYYNYYTPVRPVRAYRNVRPIVRRNRVVNRPRVNRTTPTRTRVNRTAPRTRPSSPAPRTRGRRGNGNQ